MRLLGIASALVVGLPACGEDGLEYEGEPGTPVSARFEAWVPAADVAVDAAFPGNFIVDTGSPVTVLDPDSYPGRADGVHEVNLVGFALTFPGFPVAVFDIFDYEQPDDLGFDGVLGGDVLSYFALSLDYQNERVWLDDHLPDAGLPVGVEPSSVEPVATVALDVLGGGRAILPGECAPDCGTMQLPASRALVEVALEDGEEPTWMIVDTGASAVVLDESVIEGLAAEGRPRLDGVTVGTAEGTVTAYLTRVWSMRLEEVEETSVSVLVLPSDTFFAGVEAETGLPVRGLVGGSFLRSYLTTIDFVDERLVLARYVEQSHIDPDEFVRVGFTMSRRDGSWEVQDVHPETDAALEGLVPGEVVAEIDGEAINGLSDAAVSALLGRFALGEEVPVGVSRTHGVEVLPVEVENLLPPFESP